MPLEPCNAGDAPQFMRGSGPASKPISQAPFSETAPSLTGNRILVKPFFAFTVSYIQY